MTKSQALNSFWNSFGIPAYDENSVPDDAAFPYITFSVATDSLDNLVALSGSVWYRSTSWTGVTEKTEEIAQRLVRGDRCIKLGSGYLYLYKGTPFAQRMADPEDDLIRRMYLNVYAEYLTEY